MSRLTFDSRPSLLKNYRSSIREQERICVCYTSRGLILRFWKGRAGSLRRCASLPYLDISPPLGEAGVSQCMHCACVTDRPCKGDFLSVTRVFSLARRKSLSSNDLVGDPSISIGQNLGLPEEDASKAGELLAQEINILAVHNCARYRLGMKETQAWIDKGRLCQQPVELRIDGLQNQLSGPYFTDFLVNIRVFINRRG